MTHRQREIKNQVALFISIIYFLLFSNSICFACNARKDYTIENRKDGGYDISLVCVEQSYLPITAEGFFPRRTLRYSMSLIGKGKDLSYRAHDGYYYSIDEIKSSHEAWDIGYAWVDKERKNIYLNLYWISTPDSLKPSEVHGKYIISPNK